MLLDCSTVMPLGCTHDKLLPGSETDRRLPQSLACCVPKSQCSLCVPSLTARHTHSRQKHPLSFFWQSSNPASPKPSHAFETFAANNIMSSPPVLQDSFVTHGDLRLHDATASRRKIQQTYRTIVVVSIMNVSVLFEHPASTTRDPCPFVLAAKGREPSSTRSKTAPAAPRQFCSFLLMFIEHDKL